MKVKYSELSGNALDWAFAAALWPRFVTAALDSDVPARWFRDRPDNCFLPVRNELSTGNYGVTVDAFNPCNDWALCGPLMQETLCFPTASYQTDENYQLCQRFQARIGGLYAYSDGNPLEAFVRAFVGSRLGVDVEVPGLLMEGYG